MRFQGTLDSSSSSRPCPRLRGREEVDADPAQVDGHGARGARQPDAVVALDRLERAEEPVQADEPVGLARAGRGGSRRASAEGQRETASSVRRNVRHRARARNAPTRGAARKKSRATPATGASIHGTASPSVQVAGERQCTKGSAACTTGPLPIPCMILGFDIMVERVVVGRGRPIATSTPAPRRNASSSIRAGARGDRRPR